MSVMERTALDMSAILLRAYDLGDMILASEEAKAYKQAKQVLDADETAQVYIIKLNRKKDLFEECQRFGHFHPEYHRALEEAAVAQAELDALPAVKTFKEAEEQLDELLFQVSELIAHSVSESVKVPSNKLVPSDGGCSSGGGCSGKCGG